MMKKRVLSFMSVIISVIIILTASVAVFAGITTASEWTIDAGWIAANETGGLKLSQTGVDILDGIYDDANAGYNIPLTGTREVSFDIDFEDNGEMGTALFKLLDPATDTGFSVSFSSSAGQVKWTVEAKENGVADAQPIIDTTWTTAAHGSGFSFLYTHKSGQDTANIKITSKEDNTVLLDESIAHSYLTSAGFFDITPGITLSLGSTMSIRQAVLSKICVNDSITPPVSNFIPKNGGVWNVSKVGEVYTLDRISTGSSDIVYSLPVNGEFEINYTFSTPNQATDSAARLFLRTAANPDTQIMLTCQLQGGKMYLSGQILAPGFNWPFLFPVEPWIENVPSPVSIRLSHEAGSDNMTFKVLKDGSPVRTHTITHEAATAASFYENSTAPKALELGFTTEGAGGLFTISNLTVSDTVTPTLSSNTNLSSLTVSAGTLTPVFNPGTSAYTVNVENSVTSVTVGAAVEHLGATILSGTGAHGLNVGANTINVIVKAEDGTRKTYTVNVIRKGLPGDDSYLWIPRIAGVFTTAGANNLVTIKRVAAGPLVPGDPPAIYYDPAVTGQFEIKFDITADSAVSIPRLYFTNGLNPETKMMMTFRMQENKVYLEAQVNSNGAWSSLFNAKWVENVGTKVSVKLAHVDGSDYMTMKVYKTGDPNPILSEVLAHSATTAALFYENPGLSARCLEMVFVGEESGLFTISNFSISDTITPELSSNANLVSLTPSYGTLTPDFGSWITRYEVSVPHEVATFSVSAAVQDPTAVIFDGMGTHNLSVGPNFIDVKVRAQDSTEKTYSVIVTRAGLPDDPSVNWLPESGGVWSVSGGGGKVNLRRTGTGNANILYRYPLNGEFQFTYDLSAKESDVNSRLYFRTGTTPDVRMILGVQLKDGKALPQAQIMDPNQNWHSLARNEWLSDFGTEATVKVSHAEGSDELKFSIFKKGAEKPSFTAIITNPHATSANFYEAGLSPINLEWGFMSDGVSLFDIDNLALSNVVIPDPEPPPATYGPTLAADWMARKSNVWQISDAPGGASLKLVNAADPEKSIYYGRPMTGSFDITFDISINTAKRTIPRFYLRLPIEDAPKILISFQFEGGKFLPMAQITYPGSHNQWADMIPGLWIEDVGTEVTVRLSRAAGTNIIAMNIFKKGSKTPIKSINVKHSKASAAGFYDFTDLEFGGIEWGFEVAGDGLFSINNVKYYPALQGNIGSNLNMNTGDNSAHIGVFLMLVTFAGVTLIATNRKRCFRKRG